MIIILAIVLRASSMLPILTGGFGFFDKRFRRPVICPRSIRIFPPDVAIRVNFDVVITSCLYSAFYCTVISRPRRLVDGSETSRRMVRRWLPILRLTIYAKELSCRVEAFLYEVSYRPAPNRQRQRQ